MDTRTDSDLMAAYADACDENAFAELAARHQQMVYRVCLRMLRHHQEAEDATQAVFLVLLNKASRLMTRKGEFTGWLHGVARNVCLEALRKRARRQEEAMLDETEEPAVEEYRPAHEEVLPFLDEELAGLTGVLRQAVVLRYLQNHSEAEAAQRVGCAVGTLSSRASRGIERLRQRLAKRGVALGGVALAGLLTSEASAAVPETLLPSILATVKTAVATTATATGATTTAAMLAKGAMKAMYLAKVKMVALITAASLVVAGGGAIMAQEVTQRKAAEQPVGDQTSSLIDKMARIIIPEIQFRQARMEDVVSFLNEASVTFDTITPVGQKKGVALLLYPPFLPKDEFAKWKEPSITLTARSISMLEVLRIVTESAGLTRLSPFDILFDYFQAGILKKPNVFGV